MSDGFLNSAPDIAGNIKVIEAMKSNLLNDVAAIFDLMANNKHDVLDINDKLSDIIIDTYVLGRRLGIDYESIDSVVMDKLKLHIVSQNGTNQDYADLSKYIQEPNQAQ